jgi:hypothetical protein
VEFVLLFAQTFLKWEQTALPSSLTVLIAVAVAVKKPAKTALSAQLSSDNRKVKSPWIFQGLFLFEHLFYRS